MLWEKVSLYRSQSVEYLLFFISLRAGGNEIAPKPYDTIFIDRFLVNGMQDTHFVSHHSDSPYKYSEAVIKGMLGFLVDNTCEVFVDQVFQQSVGIPMGTNGVPLLADFFHIL
jgi:hypothetical protein